MKKFTVRLRCSKLIERLVQIHKTFFSYKQKIINCTRYLKFEIRVRSVARQASTGRGNKRATENGRVLSSNWIVIFVIRSTALAFRTELGIYSIISINLLFLTVILARFSGKPFFALQVTSIWTILNSDFRL